MAMCELCLKHGDGQKRYLQAKNYAEDLMSDLRRRRFILEFFARPQELREALARLEQLEKAPPFIRRAISGPAGCLPGDTGGGILPGGAGSVGAPGAATAKPGRRSARRHGPVSGPAAPGLQPAPAVRRTSRGNCSPSPWALLLRNPRPIGVESRRVCPQSPCTRGSRGGPSRVTHYSPAGGLTICPSMHRSGSLTNPYRRISNSGSRPN